MRSLFVVVLEEFTDAGTTRGPVLGGVQVDVVVFDRAPEALDEHVVDCPSHAVHGDLHASFQEHRGEGLGGKLRSLVAVKDLWCAVEGEGLVEGGHAEVRGHGVGEAPGQHLSRVPVHDRDQVPESFFEGDVRDVGRPDLVGSSDQKVAQEIGVDRMGFVRCGRLWLWRKASDPHEAHQSLDALAIDLATTTTQD